MPTFEITTPDGKVFHVDGANAEGALAAVKKMQSEPQAPAASAAPDPSNPMAGQGTALDAAYNGLTFGFGDEAAGVVGGLFGVLDGKGFDYGYNKVTSGVRNSLKDYRDRHPYLAGASELGGALATLPLSGPLNLIRAPAMVARGAPLATRIANAGMRGAANIGNAAITGAAYGGLYGAGDSEGGLGDRLVGGAEGALLGGAVGGAAPIAGAALRTAGKAVGGALGHPIQVLSDAMRPDRAAARRVADAAVLDTGGAPAATARLTAARNAGAPMTALDLGETTRALGRASANASPEGRAALDQMVDDRFVSQADRISNVIMQAAPGVNSPQTRDLLQQAARAANRPAYQNAYMQGAGGIWHDGLETLTAAPEMQAAIAKAATTGANKAAARGQRPGIMPFVIKQDGSLALNPRGKPILKQGVQPTLEFWDHVKQNLDDAYTRAQRAGDKGAAADVLELKKQLVGYLDAAAPLYRRARQGAASFFGADDALTAGENFVRRQGDNAQARKAIARFTPAERSLFGEGFATRLLEDLRNVPDRRSVINNIFQSPAARERFELALGPHAARDMEAAMHAEGIMDLGRRAVQGNSTTARQLIEQGLLSGGIGLAAGGGNISDPTTWITAALTGYGLRRGGRLVAEVDRGVARRVAEMLASPDPQIVRQAIRMMGRNPRMLDALRRGHDRVSRALAPLLTGAGERSHAPALATLPSGTGEAQAQQ